MAKPPGHRDFHSRSHSGSCTRRKDKREIERGSEGHSRVGSSSNLVSCQSRPPAGPQEDTPQDIDPLSRLTTHSEARKGIFPAASLAKTWGISIISTGCQSRGGPEHIKSAQRSHLAQNIKG